MRKMPWRAPPRRPCEKCRGARKRCTEGVGAAACKGSSTPRTRVKNAGKPLSLPCVSLFFFFYALHVAALS